MSTNTNQVADVDSLDSDIEVLDLPETEYPVLPKKDNQISKVGEEMSGYWGDMSNYRDEDFDCSMPRLIVPSLVLFEKPANVRANPLAKMVIQNTSNLPMTYSVQDFEGPSQTMYTKSRVTKPGPGWIPPKSSVLLNIRIDVDEENENRMKSNDACKHFALHAAPIFREKHAQKEYLELFWKAFDSESFPQSHAEEHIFIIYISEHYCGQHRDWWKQESVMFRLLSVKPPKDFQNNQDKISHEEFNALWVAGDDQQEYRFALEFRHRELNRVMKRTEDEAKAGAKLAKEKEKCLTGTLIMMFVLLLVCGCAIMALLVFKKRDNDY